MLLNNKINLYNIIFYKEGNEKKLDVNPYKTKAIYNDVNIFNEPLEMSEDYFIIKTAQEVKEVRKNATEANKRRGEIFIFDRALYVPQSVITSSKITELRRENPAGCVAVSYNELVTLDDRINIIVKASRSYFAKPTDPIDKRYREDIKDLEEEIRDLEKMKLNNETREKTNRIIDLYKKKLAQGFKYRVFQFRCLEIETNRLLFIGSVDHYEKSKEYKKDEKLLAYINSHIRSQLSMDELIELKKHFNITKKRGE